MKTVTMLEFRRHADRVLRRLEGGERLLLTYRGRPVARLEPVAGEAIRSDDPFYSLPVIDDPEARSLTNAEMDREIYGL